MYQPKKFALYELVPREIFENTPDSRRYRLWNIFDDRALVTLDRLRKRHGKMNVNTWFWGGVSQYRGWRPFSCTIGADLSQHKFGRGFDCLFVDADVKEVRIAILSADIEAYEFITCVEMGVSWLHFDTRNWDKEKDGILKVYP